MTVGEKLKHQLVIHNISQTDFAKLMNVSLASVSYWLCDKRKLKVNTMMNICKVLDITPNELMQVVDNKAYRMRQEIEYLERKNEELERHLVEKDAIIQKQVLKLAEVAHNEQHG